MMSDDKCAAYAVGYAEGRELCNSKFEKLSKVAKEMLKCIDYDYEYFAYQLKELGIEIDNG